MSFAHSRLVRVTMPSDSVEKANLLNPASATETRGLSRVRRHDAPDSDDSGLIAAGVYLAALACKCRVSEASVATAAEPTRANDRHGNHTVLQGFCLERDRVWR